MAREQAEIEQSQTWTLTKVPLPMRFRPESPWSDDEMS
jgi:hypothetical protein